MTEKEIVNTLKKEKEKLINIQKRLVEERTKETHIQIFNAKDIYKYSQYFNISMNEFLLLILEVDESVYKKFVNGKIITIYSQKYCKMKEEYLKKKQKSFNRTVNWNVRTYYNKEKIEEHAHKLNINTIDFCLKILMKSRGSIRRVLLDDKLKTRLYIGKYVNTKLPEGYLETHINIIMIITKSAIRKATKRLGIKLAKTDYEDELQKCLIYINNNGNNLNKNNIPKIRDLKLREKNKRTFYLKIFYYELNELKNIKYNMQYIDTMKYKSINYNDEYCENDLEELNLNNFESIIVQDLLQGYKLEEISIKENISMNICKEIKEKLKIKLYMKLIEFNKK